MTNRTKRFYLLLVDLTGFLQIGKFMDVLSDCWKIFMTPKSGTFWKGLGLNPKRAEGEGECIP
jgi:hypothetical protein